MDKIRTKGFSHAGQYINATTHALRINLLMGVRRIYQEIPNERLNYYGQW